jgi:hypothetical protein
LLPKPNRWREILNRIGSSRVLYSKMLIHNIHRDILGILSADRMMVSTKEE